MKRGNDRYEEVKVSAEFEDCNTQNIYVEGLEDETEMTINETTVDYTAREIMNIE
jgi:hypothetical protein